MFKLILEMRRAGLLTFSGVTQFLGAVAAIGANPMALLRLAAKLNPQRVAVTDDRQRLTYRELWEQAESVAVGLHVDFGVRRGWKVAIACFDHAAAIKAIFASARLGAHVYLLNPRMPADQLKALRERMQFDFYVYDDPLTEVFSEPPLSTRSLAAYHPTDASIYGLSQRQERTRIRRAVGGKIVVMTGGTTGQPKSASRKLSAFTFLPPFSALLTQVKLARYRSVYIATPLYHGFGLASLFIGIVLRATMFFTSRFEAERACELIDQHKVDIVTLVPLMLQRIVRHDSKALAPLQRIVCGGAALSPVLAEETLDRLGPVLFNMYGTSEAGVCIIATPEMLQRKPDSIGRPISGVRALVRDESDQAVAEGETGRLCIRSAWTTRRQSWIETGDVAYRDADGDLFLCGRVDDMIVSGGENVYPIELENVLVQHPDIESCGVVGVADSEFGQRLKAVVQRKGEAMLDEASLLEWLKPRLARHQMPAIIEFREQLPYTALGKLDKRALRES